MSHLALLCLALVTAAPQQDAKQVAQDILTKGATLFDTRDAAAMAATYIDDAEISLVTGGSGMGDYSVQDIRGRAAIEQFYLKYFKDRKTGTKSKNTVEFAHYVGPDLLIIHGTFTLDIRKSAPISFVQVRAKRDDQWFIMSLQLFVVTEPQN